MEQRKPSGHHEKIPPTLAALLKSRREAEKLTRTEMAAELNISRSQLARLETGENKRPSPALLGRIAERLRVRPENLYALTGCLPPTELPSFAPYLRALHPEWPDEAISTLDNFHEFLSYKYFIQSGQR